VDFEQQPSASTQYPADAPPFADVETSGQLLCWIPSQSLKESQEFCILYHNTGQILGL